MPATTDRRSSRRGPADWTCGDFNGDGRCNGSDIQMILETNFLRKGIYAPPFDAAGDDAIMAQAAWLHKVDEVSTRQQPEKDRRMEQAIDRTVALDEA